MPPKKKRIKRVEDSDWQPNVSAKNPKENSNSGICIIHCTDAKDPLTSLSSSATWTKLLEVAKLRNDERVLEIAKSLRSEEFPNIKYHERCKKVYTHSGTLERLSKKRKVHSLTYFSKGRQNFTLCILKNLQITDLGDA